MEVCLISCNIRFDNPADLHNSWIYRRDFLTKILLSHSPDIIATQEGRFDQLYDFKSLLSSFELIDFHRSWIKPRMYPSFFIKKNKFALIQSQDLWLSETPNIAGSLSFGSSFPRLMTWMKIQILERNETLLIINTHLDHVQKNTRLEQIKVLISEIKKIWEPEQHLVIMGDFNDSPKSEIQKHLFNNFSNLNDAWKIFNSFEETSHHAFNGEDQNGSRIDWILTDKRIEVINCFMDKTHHEGRYPTDHFPIICKIKI
jgi:endonuclease/exonuclease/phosphatase family metal-dependent hydrolase